MITAILLAAAAPMFDMGVVEVGIGAKLLDGLPSVEATLIAHGKAQHCTGPTLSAVLAKIGFPAGEKLGGPALSRGVVVRARDGYAVLFSLGELDQTLGNKPAIIATQCDGSPIGMKDGPYRLIVPGEARPARSVRQVEWLRPVFEHGAPAAAQDAH